MSHLSAADDYLDYYQFAHDPFLGRGPSFKFFAAKRHSVLKELHYLARYSTLMLVVTGPHGSGKTVLRQALVASSKEHVKNIIITAAASADAASMLQQVCTALGLNTEECAIADVLQHIERLLTNGQEVRVLVENAEQIDESALLFLQRIAQGVNDASARVFIFSDESIFPVLEKVADDADLYHIIHLEAWDQHEVIEYLEQRLLAAGQTLDVFSEQQLDAIYQQSKGWPGQVNDVAKALLIEQMHTAAQAPKPVFNIPYKHLAVLAVLGVALVFVWFMQSSNHSADVEQIAETLPGEQVEQQLPMLSQGTAIELPLPLEPEPVLRAPLAQAVNTDEEEADLLASELEPQASEPIAPKVATSEPVPISTPPVEAVIETPLPQLAMLEEKPAPPTAQPKPKPAPKPTAKPVVKEAPTAAHLTGSAGHAQWYKQQAGTRYTLQVFGTRSEATARSLQQRNTAEYHYFRKEHQGKALFVVTYGSFANRNQALAAISKLPEDIRQDNPWPRTLQSIQQELR